MVSERAQKGLGIPSSTNKLNLLHHQDPYHAGSNKEGYIKLSSADSVLCADLITEKFRGINWSKFATELLYVYPRGGGEVTTLNSVARFINHFCRKGLPPLDPSDLVIVPGVTTCADLCAQILFDSGDVMLVPAPYYYRFTNDFGERGLVRIKTVPALSLCGKKTELVVKRFEKAYQEAELTGRVRGLMLVNPQNPEGGYFSLDEIRPLVKWALDKNLYVMLDEIYDLTIYEEIPDQPFRSAVELFETPAEKNKLIWMWGFSKNFALPGLRFAVMHTGNQIVKDAVIRFLMHHLPNTATQFIARELLDDHDWIEKTFLPTNLERLKKARDQVTSALDAFEVTYIKPRAGFFVLVDFSKYLDEQNIESERLLCEKFTEKRVLINAGESMMAPKPGWFRIVFSSVEPATLDEALRRIGSVLREQRDKIDHSNN